MKTVQNLKVVAMLPLAFMVLVLLTFGIGEMAGGDISGVGHLIPVVLIGLIIWLSWKKPLWGGILFLLGAALEVMIFWRMFMRPDPSMWLAPLIIMILPLAFSGLLLIMAHWMGHIHTSVTK